VRRLLRPLLPLALAGLLASGCGGEEQPAPTSDLAAVTVTGDQGAPPTVEVPEPFSVAASTSLAVAEGSGEPVLEGDVIGMEYLVLNGRTGARIDGSDFTGAPTSLVVDDSILTGLRTGLVDQKVGSRVLVAVAPQDGFEGQAAPTQSGVAADDTLLFLVDLQSTVRPRAQGEAEAVPPGLPAVALDERGAPSITIPPGSTPPGELVVQRLVRGTGPLVEAGQTIRAHYTGVKYADGSVFDSSWENGSPVPFVIGRGQVIQGWDAGLVGQPVGSQVLLIVPPAEGYGDAGQPQAGITGTDTLVFVVDILAAG
jgi:peptidylprolyl isomerase